MTTPIPYSLDGEDVKFHVDLTGQGVHPRVDSFGGESLWGIVQSDGTVLVNNLPLLVDEFTFRSLIRVRPRTFVYDGKEFTYENEYDGVVDEGPYETYLLHVIDRDAVFNALESKISFERPRNGLPDISSENFGNGAWAFCVKKELIDTMEEVLDDLIERGAISIPSPEVEE